MKHELIYPDTLIEKLEEAYQNDTTRPKLQNTGANNATELIEVIVKLLNTKYPKLCINNTRMESKENIKKHLENGGNSSKFAGYFINEKDSIDALFFYIEPNIDSANDILTRQVMPTLIGIYKNIKDRTNDLHFNCMPVYILNLCTTQRMQQNSVKKTIICAELMGFHYIDIFNNNYYDIIPPSLDEEQNMQTKINTISEFDKFLMKDSQNEYFNVDYNNKILKILNTKLQTSSNIAADLYRYSLRIIPAIYLAKEHQFSIDITELDNISNDTVVLIKNYISKFGD